MPRRSEQVIAATIISLTVVVGVYSYYASTAPSNAGAVSAGCNAPPGYILVVAGPSGFNNSVNHTRPWPVVTVQKGKPVNFFVCNVDPVAAHGFAIDHYLDAGVALGPGQTFRVSFVADRGGNFTIFCNIFCPVHIFMIGQLRVTT
jgi:heme/copper-type cytochrome/quinol oxidase subunit 2